MKINPRLLDASIYHFSFDMPSRFSDVDLQNHLNNTRLGEFYQEGRVIFFNRLIQDNNLTRAEDRRVLVAHSAIDYVAEINYPQIVAVKLGIENIGRTSLRLQMALFSEGRCAGLAKVVVVNADGNGPAPITEEWRAALSQFLLPPDLLA